MCIKGWITPRKKFVQVEQYHCDIIDGNEEAKKVVINANDSIYERLFDSRFVHVIQYGNDITFGGRARALRDVIQQCKNMAEENGLIARFDKNDA
jgi:hypothetical protein